MIQMQTRLDVADNTGAKVAQCIKVLGGTRRRYATVGDIIVASVKKSLPGSQLRTGEMVRGVIVRTKKIGAAARRVVRPVRPERDGDRR